VKFLGVFILGAIIGSFLNVLIYRVPRRKSIFWPNSYCPHCKNPINVFDNVPLISFLLLKGRCRQCKQRIPLRYFIVELLTAASGVVILFYFPDFPRFFMYWLFTCILIVISLIDIERQLIPHVFTMPGILTGLLLSSLFLTEGTVFSLAALGDSFLGVLAGGASIYLMGVVGEKLFKERAEKAGGAVGGGDITLMAMIGAFLGWKRVILTFFIAPILGSVVGLYILFKKKQEVIPYAPFLSLGAFISLLYGNAIIRYLISLVQESRGV